MLRHIRTRSDDAIVAELLHLHEVYGTCGFMFYDDELNVNPGMVGLMEKIADAQRRLGVSWRLRGFVKSERFTDEQASAMVAAVSGNCWLVLNPALHAFSPTFRRSRQPRTIATVSKSLGAMVCESKR